MELRIFVCLLVFCVVSGKKVDAKKENRIEKQLSTTDPKINQTNQVPEVSTDGSLQLSTQSINSLHSTVVESTSSTDINGSKSASTKTITAAVTDHNSKAKGKKRNKTTPKRATRKTTTEETTTEITTEETTTETTTQETTTIESTTEETTTIESTTEDTTTIESTTEETTTIESTTEDTTRKTSTPKSKIISTPRLKASSSYSVGNSSTPTKSWQKYIAKTTTPSKEHSLVEAAKPNSSSKVQLKKDYSSPIPIRTKESAGNKLSTDKSTHRPTEVLSKGNYSSPIPIRTKESAGNKLSTDKSTHRPTEVLSKGNYSSPIPNRKSTNGNRPWSTPTDRRTSARENSKYYSDNNVKVRKTFTSAPHLRSDEGSSTTSSNTSVDIKIDIDIKLRSSVTSTEFYNTSEVPHTTKSPKNREKRHERKKVVAGVILVVLISLSAAFAVLFVLVPSNSEAGNRRYHRRPDQVELIAPGRRCRTRYYDATLYMGR